MSSTTTPAAFHPPSLATKDVLFSFDANPTILSKDLEPLLRSGGGRWQLTAQRNGLERSFKFKSFKKTWEFMNVIAAECAIKKHHPEWSNVYNTTFIRWTTHSPPGLSSKDVAMAAFCDEQAAAFGEIIPDPAVEGSTVSDIACATEPSDSVGKDLADRVAVAGGDCCVPKLKR